MPDTTSSNFGPKDTPTDDSAIDAASRGAEGLLGKVAKAARNADDSAASTNAAYNGDPKSASNAERDDPPLHTPTYGPGAHGDTPGSSADAYDEELQGGRKNKPQ